MTQTQDTTGATDTADRRRLGPLPPPRAATPPPTRCSTGPTPSPPSSRGAPRHASPRSTPTGWPPLMQRLAELHDLVGRAGSYASLRFAADTADPAAAR